MQALEVLYERARTRQERFLRPMSVTAVVLFITITGVRLDSFSRMATELTCQCFQFFIQHWLIDMIRAFDAFIQPQTASFCVDPGTLNPAVMSYLNLADPKSVANSALYVTTTIVGDGFMVCSYLPVAVNRKCVTDDKLNFGLSARRCTGCISYGPGIAG